MIKTNIKIYRLCIALPVCLICSSSFAATTDFSSIVANLDTDSIQTVILAILAGIFTVQVAIIGGRKIMSILGGGSDGYDDWWDEDGYADENGNFRYWDESRND